MKENDKKNNIIVLCVIVIATFIVIIAGAAFAYLSSSISSGDSADINAKTNGTSDLLIFNAGDNVNISADNDNFGQTDDDITSTIYSVVTLNTASTTTVNYNYNVLLNATNNDFTYSSGKCYAPSASVTPASGYTTYSECTAAGFVWGRTSTSDAYSCMQNITEADLAQESYRDNSLVCLSQDQNVWAMEQVPELTIDVYKGETADDSSTCTAKNNGGVCVNSDLAVQEGITSEAACVGTNRWLGNAYENGICYVWDKSFDVTTLQKSSAGSTDNAKELYAGESISTSNNVSVNKYYKSVMTLHNLDHNQIENGIKTFSGELSFQIAQ